MAPFKTAALALAVALPLSATMLHAEEKAKVKTTLDTISPQLEPLRDLSPPRSRLGKTKAPPERAKLTTPNKSIDQGMKEAGEKPDIASSKTSKISVPKANTRAPKDKDVQQMSKESN